MSPTSRPGLGAVLSVLVVFGSSVASADDKSECIAAASQGQALRDAHKPIEARDQFRICARDQCPAPVRKDCTGWFDETTRSMPTVLVSARDPTGADLVDVTVTVDGKPLLTKLEGATVPLDPGAHTFHFERAGGASADQQVVVKENVQNQPIAIVLAGAPPAAPPSAMARPVAAVAPPPQEPAPTDERPHTWRTVGWIVGAVGAAGLVAGSVLGAMAISDKNAAHCVNGACQPGTLGPLRTTSTGSTVAFVAGGVLLAGGAGLVLFGGTW